MGPERTSLGTVKDAYGGLSQRAGEGKTQCQGYSSNLDPPETETETTINFRKYRNVEVHDRKDTINPR